MTLEFYIASVLITWFILMICSWYDTSPFNLTVGDVTASIISSLFPVINVLITVVAVYHTIRQNCHRILLQRRE